MAGVLNAIRERKEVHGEFLILGMMYTQLAGDVTWQESLLFFHANYHISESIRKTAKCGHCMCAEQGCRTMTD